MRVNLASSNPALLSIMEQPDQMITLDANFLIPPQRSRITSLGFDFETFRKLWLDPVFSAFPKLAIHEAVLDELIESSTRQYADEMLNSCPPRLQVHRDSTLTKAERMLRDAIERRIYPLTRYDPLWDNRDDRGEVKTLAYIAAKGLLYFAAHDSNALKLIENAEKWSTGLDNVQAIRMYEIIFYLYTHGLADRRGLKMLYKYRYYLTDREKESNPGWGHFIESMDKLYGSTGAK